MHRRQFLTLGAGAFAGSGTARAQTGKATSAADVDFLLAEFEKQAGHFFAAKGIDWPSVIKQFRGEAERVASDTAFLKLCQRLVAELRDGHAGIVQSSVPWPDESAGRRWTGPRVHLLVSGREVFVRQAFGDAAADGIRPGQRVEAIAGVPAFRWLERKTASLRETHGYSTDHQALYAACHWGLADWEGTDISFTLREDGGPERTVIRKRQGGPNFAPFGPVFPPPGLKHMGRQSHGLTPAGLAYIHLRDVPGDLDRQLDGMLAELSHVPGLILDLRANGGGGCDHAAVFGRFVPKGEFYDRYEGTAETPCTGNMVVILDAGVRSAGETVAGMFRETRRALAIGDSPTAGMSAAKTTVTVPSGRITVRFAVHSNMSRYNKGRGIEGIGIPPHQTVLWQPGDLLAGRDTQIAAAESLLLTGFPSDEVDYAPPGARPRK